MGRKGKQLTVIGYLDVQNVSQCLQTQINIITDNNVITFDDLSKTRYKFLAQWNFYCQHQMYFIDQEQYFHQITQDFQYPISKLPKNQNSNGTFRMFIKSLTKIIRQEYISEIQALKAQIAVIKQALVDHVKKQELQLLKTSLSIPLIRHQTSTAGNINRSFLNTQLDIAFLFSEPIYNEQKKKTAGIPVGFRPQIKKLKHALKSGQVQQVYIKAERATLMNLVLMIKKTVPKILHISCHGQQNGDLKFQDDSIENLGLMKSISPQKIKQQLKNYKGSLPQLAFINSCHSQKVGFIMKQIGVKHVITINSKDQIKDWAAQIFSQHFYRNIFRGQKIHIAFQSAKKKVQQSHFNINGCCCYHPINSHKSGCKWKQIQKDNPNAHDQYHIPPLQCECELKNQNKHFYSCKWAIKTMYAINQDFYFYDEQTKEKRIPKRKPQFKKFLFQNDILMICCCLEIGKLPHSQSQKFKMISNREKKQFQQQDTPIYSIEDGYFSNTIPEIYDYSSPQFQDVNEILPKDIFGREQQMYNFFKFLKQYPQQNVIILTGQSGSGKSTFILKAASYMLERRVISGYFNINLHGQTDPGVFRYKFNEGTGMNFNGRQINQYVKNKNFIIVFDNCDNYISQQAHQFYKDIKNLSKCLRQSKFVLVMQKNVYSDFFSQYQLPSIKFGLGPLNYIQATKTLFTKIKSKISPLVKFTDVAKIIQEKNQLRNPKAIQSICHSILNSSKKEFPLSQITKKINAMGEDTNKLIKENIEKLRVKQYNSFQLLIFIAQFSEGISLGDLNRFSLYYIQDKGQQQNSNKITLPVRKDMWISDLSKLARNMKIGSLIDQISNDFSSQILTYVNQIGKYKDKKQPYQVESQSSQRSFDGKQQGSWIFTMQDSYFLSKVGKDKISVPKYLREYIRNTYQQQTTKKMSYIFVSYICVMLEMLFGILRNQFYVHEQIFNCSTLSISGAFSRKTNLEAFYDQSITISADRARKFQSVLEKIIFENRNFRSKITLSDPSVFILNHKQDFLNLYNLKWEDIYYYLIQKKTSEHKIFLCFFSNILIHIPSVLRFIKASTTFQKNLVLKSMNILKKLKPLLQPKQRYLELYFKLSMMKVQLQLDEQTPSKKNITMIFQDVQYMVGLAMQKITDKAKGLLELISWEKKHSIMYLQYQTFKDQTKNIQKIKQSLKQWKNCHQEQLLGAKHAILLCQMYYSFYKSDYLDITGSNKYLRIKNKNQKQMNQKFFNLANQSYHLCIKMRAFKLALTARLIQLQLIWELQIQKSSTKTLVGEQCQDTLNQCKEYLQDCQNLFKNKKYKIAGFSYFEQRISYLTKKINEKFWQNSRNTIIFMRAVPITRNSLPIIPNLVRKSHNFRKEIQNIMKEKHSNLRQFKQQTNYSCNSPYRHNEAQNYQIQKSIMVSVKFQILTKINLKKQLTKYGPSLMICTANTYVENKNKQNEQLRIVEQNQKLKINEQQDDKQNVYLIVQDEFMGQQKLLINKQFAQELKFDSLNLLIAIGQNSHKLIKKLSKLLPKQKAPIMIALSQEPQKFYIQQQQRVIQQILFNKQKKNAAEIAYIKQFIGSLHSQKITTPQQLRDIHNKCSFKVQMQFKSRIKTQFISHSFNNQNQKKLYINLKQGNFKNLSPDILNSYNVSMDTTIDLKDSKSFFVIRRWQYLRPTLSHIFTQLQNKNPAHLNIYGEKKAGKTFFAQQLVRIMVERQLFPGGVFFINGDMVQKKYGGDFYKYIQKQSEKGKLPQLNYFLNTSERQVMLVIDDFDHIISRQKVVEKNSFLDQILKLSLNLIVITNNLYNNDKFLMRSIKLKKMNELQINILAYNIIDQWTQQVYQAFQVLKVQRKCKVSVKDLLVLMKKVKKKQKFKYTGVSNNHFRTWEKNDEIQIKPIFQLSEIRKQKKRFKQTPSQIQKELIRQKEYFSESIELKQAHSMMEINRSKQYKNIMQGIQFVEEQQIKQSKNELKIQKQY